MIIIKPDAFQRRLVGQILARFERLGHIKKMLFTTFTLGDCENHYAAHTDKPFYAGLCKHMCSGPSLIVDLDCRPEAVRELGLILRQLHGVPEGPANLIHMSDSTESNEAEARYWFHDRPIQQRQVLPESSLERPELVTALFRGDARVAVQGEGCELENVPESSSSGGDISAASRRGVFGTDDSEWPASGSDSPPDSADETDPDAG